MTMMKIQLRMARIITRSLVAGVLTLLVGAAALAQGDRTGPASSDSQRIRLNEQSQLELFFPIDRERVQPYAPDRDVNPTGGELPGTPYRTDRDRARVVPPVDEQHRNIQSPAPEFGVTQDGRACDIQPHIAPVAAPDVEPAAVTVPSAGVSRSIAPEGTRIGKAKPIHRDRGTASTDNHRKNASRRAKA